MARTRSRRTGFALLLGALLTGLLLACGFPGDRFPTLSLGFLIPFAFVPLFIAMENTPLAVSGRTARRETALSPIGRGRRAFFLCWVAGATLAGFAFFWVTQPAILFGNIPSGLTYLLFFVYCIASGLFLPCVLSPFIWNTARSTKKNLKPFPVLALALLATLIEHYIPRFFFWTFGSLMHSVPSVNQWSAYLGFSGASFFVLLTSAYLARAVTDTPKSPGRLASTVVGLALLWGVIIGVGNWRLGVMDEELASGPKTRVGFIQPNFTFSELSSNPTRDAQAQDVSLDTLVSMSQKLLDETTAANAAKPELIVWPESVVPFEFAWSEPQQQTVKDFAKSSGVPILVEAFEFDPDDVKKNGYRRATTFAASFLLRPDGSRSKSYRKWVPIPFGEVVPFEEYFPWLGELVRDNIGNTSKVGLGTSVEALAYSPQFKVAPLICFDSINPDLPRKQTVTGGASIFVNQANFVWMGRSNAGAQFRELDRFRAIENGRSLLLAANTGPSLAFDPLGRSLTEETRLMTQASRIVELPVSTHITFYSRFGELPLLVASLLAFLRILFASTRRAK